MAIGTEKMHAEGEGSKEYMRIRNMRRVAARVKQMEDEARD